MEKITLTDYLEKLSSEFNDKLSKIKDSKSEEYAFNQLELFIKDKLNEIQRIKKEKIKQNKISKFNKKSSFDISYKKKNNENIQTPKLTKDLHHKKKNDTIKKSKSNNNLLQNVPKIKKIDKQDLNNKTKRLNKTPEPLIKKKINKIKKNINDNQKNNIIDKKIKEKKNITNKNINQPKNLNNINTKKSLTKNLTFQNSKNKNNISKTNIEKIKKKKDEDEDIKKKTINNIKLINSKNNNPIKQSVKRAKTPIIRNDEENIDKMINQSSHINIIYRDIEQDETEIIDELNLRITINRENNKNIQTPINEYNNNNIKNDIVNDNKNEESSISEKEKSTKEEYTDQDIEKEMDSIINETGDIFNDIYYKNTQKLLNINYVYDESKIKYKKNKIYIENIIANYYITDEYREIEYTIKIKAKADEHTFFSSYSFPLDFVKEIETIELINYSLPIKTIKCEITENEPLIRFSNLELSNDDLIELKFKVKGIRKEKIIYYIRDYFYVTKSAFNSVCNIKITFEPKLIFCNSINNIFSIDQKGHLFYKGIIPENGLEERIDITKYSTRFKISKDIFFFPQKQTENNSTTIKIPNLLQGDKSNYNIESYKIKIFQDNYFKQTIENPYTNENEIKISLSDVQREIKIITEMIIENKFVNSINEPLDNSDIIKLTEEDRTFFLLKSKEIIKNSKKKNEPIPLKLSRWINENIKYDINYKKYDKTPREILIEKKGVCKHLSQLLTYMLKSLNINSILTSGLVSDETEREVSPHAWCTFKYKNKWSSIDPTWNINSGYLPLSHILIGFKSYEVSYIGTSDFDIQFGDYKIEYLNE